MKLSEQYEEIIGWNEEDGTAHVRNEVVKLEAENEALREYATHKPRCYESGNECICGLDALLTGGEHE